jgi:membrane carboxypeptidase/penicillin-binding protein
MTFTVTYENGEQSQMSYENVLRNIRINPTFIKRIDKQTAEICNLGVSIDPYVIRYVKDQNNEICLKALRQNYCFIEFIYNTDRSFIEEAIKIDPGLVLSMRKDQVELLKEYGLYDKKMFDY